jgi:hypothetical protein
MHNTSTSSPKAHATGNRHTHTLQPHTYTFPPPVVSLYLLPLSFPLLLLIELKQSTPNRPLGLGIFKDFYYKIDV